MKMMNMTKKLTLISALMFFYLGLNGMQMNEVPYRVEVNEEWIEGPLNAEKIKKLAKDLKEKPAVIRCNTISLEEFKKLLPLKEQILGFNLNYCPKINSLKGLSEFPNIEHIMITGQDKEWDLTELAKMKKLKYLQIANVNYKDLSFLKSLNGLEELTFFMQPKGVSDLSWVKGKSKLRVLKFYNMRCPDISALESLTNLEVLSLYMVYPKSVEPLRKLKKLKWLDLYAVSCEDLSPVGELTELKVLNLYMTKAANYNFLNKLKTLEDLSATFCKIKSLNFLAGASSLKYVSFHNSTEITDWSGIKDAKSLDSLTLEDTRFTDLSLIKDLKLKRLNLSDCKIKDFTVLKSLKTLEELSVENTEIESLTTIAELPNLKRLEACGTKIKSIKPLAKSSKLSSLSVDKDKIPAKEIEELQALFKKQKKYLYISAR